MNYLGKEITTFFLFSSLHFFELKTKIFYEDLQDLLELTPPKKIPNQTWKQILRVSSFDVPASEHLQKALLGVGVMAWESVGGQTVYFGSTNQYES